MLKTPHIKINNNEFFSVPGSINEIKYPTIKPMKISDVFFKSIDEIIDLIE